MSYIASALSIVIVFGSLFPILWDMEYVCICVVYDRGLYKDLYIAPFDRVFCYSSYLSLSLNKI